MNEEFNKEFNDIRLRQYSIAMEALNDLFHRIPFGEKNQFSDGRTGSIKPFFEPKWKEDGTLVAGIDIHADTNGQITSTVTVGIGIYRCRPGGSQIIH